MRSTTRHPFVAIFLLIGALAAGYLSMSEMVTFWPLAPDDNQLVEQAAALEAGQLEQIAKRVVAAILLVGAIGALLGGRWGTIAAGAAACTSLAVGAYLVVWALFLDESAWRFLTYLILLPPAIVIVILSLVALRVLSRSRTKA